MAGKNEALFKPFLFADQELGQLVRDIAPRGGPLADAAAQLREGNPGEAEVIITAAMISRPDEVGGWHRLLLACALDRKGNRAGAISTLRQLLETAKESRIRLWTWTELRRLGDPVDPARAARVEGLVVEVNVSEPAEATARRSREGRPSSEAQPSEPEPGRRSERAVQQAGEGVDTLAAYADGSARYLLHTGARVIWDAPDKRLAEPIARLISAAEAIAADLPVRRLAGEPGEGIARITLLTPAGARSIEEPLAEVSTPASPRAALFREATALLDEILAIARW